MIYHKSFIETKLDQLITIIERIKKVETVTWGYANWKRSMHRLKRPTLIDRLKYIAQLLFEDDFNR